MGYASNTSDIPWLSMSLFFFCWPIFSTLALPFLLFYQQIMVVEPIVMLEESLAMTFAYAVLTFLIPAGFLQVSKTDRMRSAFNLRRNLTLVVNAFPAYLNAWIGSGLMSLVGHLCMPFSPWGVVWCYLGIVYAFNDIPLAMSHRIASDYLSQSWLSLLRTTHWERIGDTRLGLLAHYRLILPPGKHCYTQEVAATATIAISVVKLGFIHIPIPTTTRNDPHDHHHHHTDPSRRSRRSRYRVES